MTGNREIARLVEVVGDGQIAVLTGAGCSTESGIPDYRGPTSRRRRAPIQHQEFLTRARARQRYWARSTVGWHLLAAARPNAAHRALAELEARGRLTGLITQNVDRLHRAAGSQRVVELHGALEEVICLGCEEVFPRADVQARLLELNPAFRWLAATAAPDGDAELDEAAIDAFRVPACPRCSGVLKPHVVFFGGSVPRPVVDRAAALIDAADALVVVGSSLQVFSGYRFARRAAERGLPIAIINLGPTRADPLAACRIEARAGKLLPAVARALSGRHGARR